MNMGILMISAAISCVISAPWLTFMRIKGIVGKRTEQIIEAEEKAGRVVIALQVSAVRTKGEPGAKSRFDRMRLWLCTYSYNVNGIDYKMHTQSEDAPPREIELFYPEGHPEKAVYRGKADLSVSNTFFAVLPVLLWAIIYWALMFFS